MNALVFLALVFALGFCVGNIFQIHIRRNDIYVGKKDK